MSPEGRLQAILTLPSAEAFAPTFLEQVPFAKVKSVMAQTRARGAVRDVRPLGEDGLWEAVTDSGKYPLGARFDEEGRIAWLLIPPLQPTGLVARLLPWLPWFVLPSLLMGAVGRAGGAHTRWEWIMTVPGALTLVAFLLTTLVWAQTSVRLRPLAVLALAVLLLSALRLPALPVGPLPGVLDALGSVPTTVIFAWLTVLALRGRRVPPNPVALGPVLQGGTFVAAQAGSTVVVNYHVAHKHMRYAVDYLGVGRNGRHARGVMPADPCRYAIFGATVLAPLDGVVEAVRNDLPDLSPPRRDPLRAPSNFVSLRSTASNGREVRVVMAHLRQGSVRVGVGDRVRAGETLGKVGNSGNTTEPHLHLGVTVGGKPGEPLSGEGVAFTVGGRFPVRGQVTRG